MFSISCDRYTVSCEVWELPFLHEEYRKCARLVEEIGLEETEGDIWFIAVADDSNLPFLVVIQRFSPAEPCFSPGILLIPETKLLLIGAGERLLAYDLAKPARLWEDKADTGFWRWKRHVGRTGAGRLGPRGTQEVVYVCRAPLELHRRGWRSLVRGHGAEVKIPLARGTRETQMRGTPSTALI